MNEVKMHRVYKLYDIFNDFNRLSILIQLYNEELSIDEISERTNIKNIVIFHQLEYLISKKVVSKKEIDEIEKYEISDKTLSKLIGKMITYVTKN